MMGEFGVFGEISERARMLFQAKNERPKLDSNLLRKYWKKCKLTSE